MSQENVEIVRRALEADDDETAWADIRSDVKWVVAKEHPDSRTLQNREEVLEYLAEWGEMVEELRFDATDYTDAGERVVALGKIRGTGKGSGVPTEVPLALVYVFEGDKVARVEEYLDPSEALEAAGVSE